MYLSPGIYTENNNTVICMKAQLIKKIMSFSSRSSYIPKLHFLVHIIIYNIIILKYGSMLTIVTYSILDNGMFAWYYSCIYGL